MRVTLATLSLLALLASCEQRDLQLDAEREELRRKIEKVETSVAAGLRECWKIEDAEDAADAKATAAKPPEPPRLDPNSPNFMAEMKKYNRYFDSPEHKAYDALSDEHMRLMEQGIGCRKRVASDQATATAARERVAVIDTVQPPKVGPPPAPPSEFGEDVRRTEARSKAFWARHPAESK